MNRNKCHVPVIRFYLISKLPTLAIYLHRKPFIYETALYRFYPVPEISNKYSRTKTFTASALQYLRSQDANIFFQLVRIGVHFSHVYLRTIKVKCRILHDQYSATDTKRTLINTPSHSPSVCYHIIILQQEDAATLFYRLSVLSSTCMLFI